MKKQSAESQISADFHGNRIVSLDATVKGVLCLSEMVGYRFMTVFRPVHPFCAGIAMGLGVLLLLASCATGPTESQVSAAVLRRENVQVGLWWVVRADVIEKGIHNERENYWPFKLRMLIVHPPSSDWADTSKQGMNVWYMRKLKDSTVTFAEPKNARDSSLKLNLYEVIGIYALSQDDFGNWMAKFIDYDQPMRSGER